MSQPQNVLTSKHPKPQNVQAPEHPKCKTSNASKYPNPQNVQAPKRPNSLIFGAYSFQCKKLNNVPHKLLIHTLKIGRFFGKQVKN
jgi:hypothetical protein